MQKSFITVLSLLFILSGCATDNAKPISLATTVAINSSNEITELTYLIDMPSLSSTNIYGKLRKNKLYTGQEVIFDNIKYDKSLTAHAPNKGVGIIKCKLDGKYNQFKTSIAVAKTSNIGDVVFSVKADDETIYTSEPILSDTTPTSIDLDVTGVNKLELIVDPVKHNFGDHAVWCSPRLIPKIESN